MDLNWKSALHRAGEIDCSMRKRKLVGPLAGVSFAVKDTIETTGIVTAIGVADRRDTIPDRDTTIFYRMKVAGTNLPDRHSMDCRSLALPWQDHLTILSIR